MKYLLLSLVALVPNVSFAEEQFAVRGIGASSCGQFLEDQRNPDMKSMQVSWAQGFLSGLNIADAQAGKDFVLLPDDSTITLYLSNYCSKNPLERPIGGALTLYKELRARHAKESRP
ncbi:hypothetical protein [Thermomonas fusca]